MRNHAWSTAARGTRVGAAVLVSVGLKGWALSSGGKFTPGGRSKGIKNHSLTPSSPLDAPFLIDPLGGPNHSRGGDGARFAGAPSQGAPLPGGTKKGLLRAPPSRITPPLRPQCRDAQRVAPATPWGVSEAAKPSQKSKTSRRADRRPTTSLQIESSTSFAPPWVLPPPWIQCKIGPDSRSGDAPRGSWRYPLGVSTLAGTGVQGFEFHESTPRSKPAASQIKLQTPSIKLLP